MFYIWSNRHREWWRAERAGYTSRLSEAGQYDGIEAGKIVLAGLPSSNIAIRTNFKARFDGDAESVERELDLMKRL